MTEPSLFAPRLLALWIALGAITFGLALWLMAAGESEATVGPSTYSKSAIGHAGIAEILKRLEIPVVSSRSDSVHRAGPRGVLVLAEPEMRVPGDGKLEGLLRAETVLLVLPKWQGQDDPGHPGWIARAEPGESAAAESALTHAIGRGRVLAPQPVESWSRNDLGPTPHFTGPVQLVKSSRLTPIVAAADGILLGEFAKSGRTIWVLSDPEILDNHGLAEGNAGFVLEMIERLRNGGTVVFDESIHGFDPVARNPFDLAVQKRFVLVTILALAAIGLLLWATIGRFGASETAPPPLAAGKQNLIRNMAELMDYAGYQQVLVRRYVDAVIRNAAAQLHPPRGLDGAAGLAWLQRLSAAQGGAVDALAVKARVAVLAAARTKDLPALFVIAREIRQWKQELMDGSSRGAQDRRSDPRRGAQGGRRPG